MYPLTNYLTINQANRHTELNSVVSSINWQKYILIISVESFKANYTNCQIQTDIEEQLETFISWVLRVTVTGEYSGNEAMELLDQAWMAQKLVWWLRESQN